MIEEPAFARQPAAIARKTTIGADDAVTGHDDRDRIGAIGETDGPARFRRAEIRVVSTQVKKWPSKRASRVRRAR
jgi:hypothetical protein